MKVLFISRRFYPDIIGGGEISALKIAEAVSKQGISVSVLTFHDKKTVSIEKHGKIKIIRHPIPKLKFAHRLSNMDYMFWQISKIGSKIINKEQPDIIHLLNFDPVPLSPIIFKKKFNMPIFATVNGPNFGCFTGNAIDYNNTTCTNCKLKKRFLCSKNEWGTIKGLLYYLYSLWYMELLKKSYKKVNKFFTVSDAMQQFLINMKVQKKNITTIHNPFEPQKKVKTNLKKELKIENKKVLLYAGRITEEKGIHYIIKSLKHLQNVIYIVVGKGNYENELKKLSKKEGLSEKVKFIGFVHPNKIKEFYSITDIAVLVEDFFEPFSRFLLDAISFEVTVMANDIGGNKDLVESENLIKSKKPTIIANKIKEILKKGSKPTQSEKFSYAYVGKQIKEEYENTKKYNYFG